MTDLDGSDAEVPLGGGYSTPGVVRIGDTVRRPILRDPRFRHALLRHLSAVGFAAAPRVLGIDEQGREILGFIQGIAAGHYRHFDDRQIAGVAALLRGFHDATEGSALCDGQEVVCHNDWGPGNAIFVDDMPVAMIDLDTAAPGTRLWDTGRAAWNWLNFGDPAYAPAEQRRRLAIFVEGYGHPEVRAHDVAIHAAARQASLAVWARGAGKVGVEAWARASADWTAKHIVESHVPCGLDLA
jgi:aminoglycoside phosphotransferase (APT) family kinase protein